MSEGTLGILVSLLGIVVGLVLNDWNNFSIEKYWGRYAFLILCFVGLFASIIRSSIKHRNAHKGSEILLDLQRRAPIVETELPKADFYGCQQKMYSMCSKISEAFTTIKGNRISTCVKYLGKENNVDVIKTLARDDKSLDSRAYQRKGSDTLNDNFDFQSIVYNHSRKENPVKWSELHYCINNLPHVYGYYNSHLEESDLSNGIKGFLFRHNEWPLPYKSALIVPITNPADDTFYGFLCIDSKNSFCFNKKDLGALQSAALSIWKLVDITITKLPKEN